MTLSTFITEQRERKICCGYRCGSVEERAIINIAFAIQSMNNRIKLINAMHEKSIYNISLDFSIEDDSSFTAMLDYGGGYTNFYIVDNLPRAKELVPYSYWERRNLKAGEN